MKTIWFLVIGCLSLFSIALADADVKDLGDICYNLDDGTLKPPIFGTIGILYYGTGENGHIALHAPITSNSGPTQGSATMVGENIIVSLNGSYVVPILSADGVISVSGFSFTHMVIDAATLMGTYTTMNMQITPPPARNGVTSGKVMFFPCQ